MIETQLRIEGGEVRDMREEYGFIYMDSDERTWWGEKDEDVTEYAEEGGEHRDGRTVAAAFDYTVKFLVEARGGDLRTVNRAIGRFNRAVREELGGGVVRKREVTFYNLYNHVKIVGTAEVVSEPKEVWKSGDGLAREYAVVEVRIRVSDPGRCDFDWDGDLGNGDDGLRISLEARGLDLVVNLSRELREGEHVVMLRRGVARKRSGGFRGLQEYFPLKVKRKRRWQVYYRWYYQGDGVDTRFINWPFYLDGEGVLKHKGMDVRDLYTWSEGHLGAPVIRKSSGSRGYSKARGEGVIFGVAVYKGPEDNPNRHERVSNVCYFRSVYAGDWETVLRV